eukprot:10144875-Alexandrium_andersonii.AAC.1
MPGRRGTFWTVRRPAPRRRQTSRPPLSATEVLQGPRGRPRPPRPIGRRSASGRRVVTPWAGA